MWSFVSVLCLTLASVATASGVAKMAASPMTMNIACLTLHCPEAFAAAMIDPVFKKNTKCQKTCDPFFANDTTPEKLHYQNCTTKCALTYDSPAGDKFLACAMNNNCVGFPPINSTCPVPEVDPETSLADLAGEWWQHWGKNQLWDCYPCQHIHSMTLINDTAFCAQTRGPDGPVQAPCWAYKYSYDLFTETGVQYFNQTWQLPAVQKGKAIDIFYNYLGSNHNETWYILKATPRYVILVDCSYMMDWTNVGSIVWVRPNIELTDTELAEIKTVYQAKLGWSFPDQFCHDRHGAKNCMEPSKSQKHGRPLSFSLLST
jgi:hypothetical protein